MLTRLARLAHPSLVCPLALLPLAAPAAAQATLGSGPNASISFEVLARDVLSRNGLKDANPDTLDVTRLLEQGWVHARVGLFRVYMPGVRAAREGDAARLQAMLAAMVRLQEAWLDWLEPAVDVGDARKDLKTLGKWVERLDAGDIARAAAEHGRGDLLEHLSVKDAVSEAAARFGAFMGRGTALGLEREDVAEPIVLAPTRKDFIEMVALAGWLYPNLQGVYWHPSVAHWTHFYFDQYKILSLEFANAERGWSAGIPMDQESPDGMAQQISQLAGNSLMDGYFGSRIAPSLANSLSINLVIDIYGECDTRVDGDLRARRTEAYERFVPGGIDGGILPAIAADSRWRADLQGSDHFVGVLAGAQRAGAAEVRRSGEKLPNFELINDTESQRAVVRGPFLGKAAKPAELGDDFEGDYLEFLRSYCTCFMHWLRERALGSAKKSEQAFAELLVDLAHDPGEGGLEGVFVEHYGRILSAGEPTKQDLEGSFLLWLSKQ